MFVLIKLVWSFAQPLQMAVGIEFGRRQHDLLLIPITISIIALQIICAENGAILHH
jgi:hypothetical protein